MIIRDLNLLSFFYNLLLKEILILDIKHRVIKHQAKKKLNFQMSC